MDSMLLAAHAYCVNNRPALEKDKKCGCFYCLKIYDPSEIREWIPDALGSARCPYCGVDAVIGESAGYPITKEFLSEMKRRWF